MNRRGNSSDRSARKQDGDRLGDARPKSSLIRMKIAPKNANANGEEKDHLH